MVHIPYGLEEVVRGYGYDYVHEYECDCGNDFGNVPWSVQQGEAGYLIEQAVDGDALAHELQGEPNVLWKKINIIINPIQMFLK